MTRKDEFLRAIQLQPFHRSYDLPLAFGLALNLSEQYLPPNLRTGAKQFVAGISSSSPSNLAAGADKKESG